MDNTTKDDMQKTTPKTVRELGIMMAANERVFIERLDRISENMLRLTESVDKMSETKADKEDLERLLSQVAAYQESNKSFSKDIAEIYVTKREAKVGATVLTIAITVLGFIMNFVRDWRPQ